MKPKDIFGLIARLMGLIFLYESAEKIPLAVSIASTGFKSLGFFSVLFMVGWPLAVAYWFFRGAPPVSRIAYPDDPKTSSS